MRRQIAATFSEHLPAPKSDCLVFPNTELLEAWKRQRALSKEFRPAVVRASLRCREPGRCPGLSGGCAFGAQESPYQRCPCRHQSPECRCKANRDPAPTVPDPSGQRPGFQAPPRIPSPERAKPNFPSPTGGATGLVKRVWMHPFGIHYGMVLTIFLTRSRLIT